MANRNEPATSVSAPDYVNLVLDWIGDQLNDLTKFPDDAANEVKVYSTPQFAVLCGQIFRRLFRIYGYHLLLSFFDTIEALGMTPHLNTCFKHFLYFCSEFALLPERELEPLKVLVKPVRKEYFAFKTGK
jgi:MOB kinase activator 1